jgi:hypothetical protein
MTPKDAMAAIFPPTQASPYFSVVASFLQICWTSGYFLLSIQLLLCCHPYLFHAMQRCRTARNKATKTQLALKEKGREYERGKIKIANF